MPASISERGLLLLSGGVDSPVAGYLIRTRVLSIDAVYFHSYPFTSHESENKVKNLATILAELFPSIVLHIETFIPIQLQIKKHSSNDQMTILMHCAMTQCTNNLGKEIFS